MRLFDFVEKHDAVRAPPHRFGELTRLVVPGVAGRRAEQARDGVRFGELREIDANQGRLAAEERFGERFRELGLADAARAPEEEACPAVCADRASRCARDESLRRPRQLRALDR